MRIAAVADLHFPAQASEAVRSGLSAVNDEADVLLLAGDLTNYGRLEDMESLLRVLAHVSIPIVAVLGNHEFESGQAAELAKMLTGAGIHLLDGSAYEQDGVGFAGTKGFLGGFGRGVLTAFGEPEVKAFVRAAINESLKLERALSQLRTDTTVVVLHYAPTVETVVGESPEIFPYLGTSRLADVIDRHGADLAVHGHAHRGTGDGRTPGGIPVGNVALGIVLKQTGKPYRIFRL